MPGAETERVLEVLSPGENERAAAEPSALELARNAARHDLGRLLDSEEEQDTRAEYLLRAYGMAGPSDAIVACARELDVELIVMGKHNLGFVEHLLAGSVAEKSSATPPPRADRATSRARFRVGGPSARDGRARRSALAAPGRPGGTPRRRCRHGMSCPTFLPCGRSECSKTYRPTSPPWIRPSKQPVRKCMPPNTRASTDSKPACDRLLKLRVMLWDGRSSGRRERIGDPISAEEAAQHG